MANHVQMYKDYGEKHLNITEFIIYKDEGFSGGNISRPEFQQVLNL
ncbi:recombinase family protein [Tepidibacter mesophilus]